MTVIQSSVEAAVVCERCGVYPAQHTIARSGRTERICCQCYVRAGHPPADWHRLCMFTYREAQQTLRDL